MDDIRILNEQIKAAQDDQDGTKPESR